MSNQENEPTKYSLDPKTYKDLRLYILMRNDLASMTPGRCMAQASHAASQLAFECDGLPKYNSWRSQTKDGFGTAIILGADQGQIYEITDKLSGDEYVGKVIDPDYRIKISPEIASFINWDLISTVKDENGEPIIDGDNYIVTREEMTCAYVLCTKEEAHGVLDHLDLY